MRIYLAVDVDRTEGRQMGAEFVAEELVATLEGESLEVEDSTFEVTTVESVLSVKQGPSGLSTDAVLLALDEVAAAYMAEHPIQLDGEPGHNRSELEKRIEHLLFSSGVGELISAAKARRAKAQAKRR